jgi:HEAT repeat protein
LRGQAAEGIGDVLGRSRGSNSLRRAATEALREALDDVEPEVRFWAVRALGVLRCAEVRTKLEALARADDAVCPHMWTVGEEAADALAFLDTGSWPDREALTSTTIQA